MSGLTVTQQHIQSATNIRVSRNEMVPVFDALCTGTISVFFGAFVAEKWTLCTHIGLSKW